VREGDVNASAEEFAIAACKRGLFIIAVTDHHRCENAEEIAAATDQIRSEGQNLYPNNNLLVLPGMEIAVEENAKTVHVLAIFPENTHPYQIMPILEDTGVETDPEHRTPDSKVTNQRLTTIIRRIRDQGGLAILAHVNSSNGYRQEMRDAGITDEQILVNIQGLSVSAVEISKPEDLQHFYEEDRLIPCVIGSDAHYLDEVGGKEFITRVKMTAPCFSDLERALQDPETRIRFQDPSVTEIKRVHGISLEGGFLDGQIVGFTSNLNCLIGGRGAGKSTLIEAIRYLFQHEVPGNRRRDVENLRTGVLAECTATLVFEDQFGEKYVLRRTYGDPQSKVMTIDGSERHDIDLSLSQNLRVSIYGWSEIEGIAQDTAQQLELIDSFIEAIPELKSGEEAALNALEANARDIKTAISNINRETGQIGNLPELRQELEKLGEEETEEEKQKVKVDNESDLVEKIEARFDGMREQIEALDLPNELDEISQEIQKAKDEEKVLFEEVFENIDKIITQAREGDAPLQILKADFLEKLNHLLQKVSQETEKLTPQHREVIEAFQNLLEKLEQPEAKEITRRREQLRAEIRVREKAQERQKEAEKWLKELLESRKAALENLLDFREKLFQIRAAHVKEITTKLPKGRADVDITLEVVKQGDRKHFIKMLEEKLVNLPRKWRDRGYPLVIARHCTPIEFVDLLRTKNKAILAQAGFSEDEAEDIVRHFEDKPEDLMELEICSCADLPLILFDVEGQKKPIERLSPGQRCTALLPIILLETDTPLIIDQPEDNLDNQFIFDLVVNTMRILKERRQIIVATHNPNIPVSGDAENILVFKPEGHKGILERNGSIDYEPVIDEVKSIMEGGEDAFVVRANKYGFFIPT
jgi:energy-coupling factor transporter ATP-binding protein EcfA2/histidinol phosphatase-like PHP family hydrolase